MPNPYLTSESEDKGPRPGRLRISSTAIALFVVLSVSAFFIVTGVFSHQGFNVVLGLALFAGAVTLLRRVPGRGRPRISTAAICSFALFIISVVFVASGVPIYQGFILAFALALYATFEVFLCRASGMGLLLIILPLVTPVFGCGAMYMQRVSEGYICPHNMYDIRDAIMEYAQQNNERFPDPQKWCDLLVDSNSTYHIDRKSLRCRADKVGPSSYAINPNARSSSTKTDIVLLFECKPGWNQHGGPELLEPSRHGGPGLLDAWRHNGCYIVFCDWHYEFVTADRFSSLCWSDADLPR